MRALMLPAQIPSRFSEGCEASMPASRWHEQRHALFAENIADQTLRIAAFLAGALNRRPARDGREGVREPAGDLSVRGLMDGFARGLRVEAPAGPAILRAPATRFLATPEAMSRALAGPCAGMGEALPTVSFDTDVEPVLLAIARPRARQTGGLSARRFLTTPLLHALATLFDAGHAHCVAARDGRGRLVGGAFGVAVGRLFILEGLSEEAPGAGTLVLARLAEALAAFGYRAIEAPPGSALAAAGFAPVGRDDFNRLLGEGLGESRRGRWPGEGAARFNPSDAPPAAEPDLRRAA